MIYFCDTNVLLEDIDYFASLKNKVISSHTLNELEKSKYGNGITNAAARRAIHWLTEHSDEYEVFMTGSAAIDVAKSSHLDWHDPDVIVCCSAYLWKEVNYEKDFLFVTHNLNCRNIAEKVLYLSVEWLDKKEKIYKGYHEISGGTEYINDYMANIDYSGWYVNEYLLINNTDDGTTKEMRFDGTMFVPLRLPQSKFIKGKNSLQRCALDMLNNPSITICSILGNYGSGKTLLTMKMAIYAVKEKGWQSQILGIREPHGEGKEVGFLPGDLQSKTDFFFAPLVDQLDGGEFEVERMKQQGVLEEIIPYYLKGRTFNNTCIIVDEAEDLTEKQIRLIGTRVGENSRIFFNGDHQQSTVDSSANNALIKIGNELRGNPMFATIYLEDDVRSATSKLFANLFK